MEEFLPYITTIATALITVLGFGFSAWRYVDTRYREEKRRNYENFQEVMDKLIKCTEPSKTANATELFYAIYQLQNFKEYSNTFLPILIHLQDYAIEKNSSSINDKHYLISLNTVLKDFGIKSGTSQIATSGLQPSSQ